MKEIARKNYGYIFYEVNEKYLLSTLCGTVGLFTVDFFLNKQETKQYQEIGIDFINDLAENVIQNHESYWNRCIITNIDYLMFGVFNSESIYPYSIYKIDKQELNVDTSETWHNNRFKQGGFVFKGSRINVQCFEKVKHLIYSIPQEIYKCNLKLHNTTDNKIENKIVLEYKSHENIYQFTIDIVDLSDKQKLTDSMKNFVTEILSGINLIKNGC